MINTTHNQHHGFAPGKVILSGEHSVVYGHPAVVMATTIGSTVLAKEVGNGEMPQDGGVPVEFSQRLKKIFSEKVGVSNQHLQLRFSTELPLQSGMGSSASFAAAAFRALSQAMNTSVTDDQLFELVQESERAVHGNPSGVDAAAVVYQGAFVFRKEDGKIQRRQLSSPESSFLKFFLVQSGKPTETTKEMVSGVAKRWNDSESMKRVVTELGSTTQKIVDALEEGNKEVFLSQIKKNEQLLEELGVVSESAQKLIRELEALGASAKVTGAGGRAQGSGMIIVFHEDQNQLDMFCRDNNVQLFETSLSLRREL
jgi:mevalonate kinase